MPSSSLLYPQSSINTDAYRLSIWLEPTAVRVLSCSTDVPFLSSQQGVDADVYRLGSSRQWQLGVKSAWRYDIWSHQINWGDGDDRVDRQSVCAMAACAFWTSTSLSRAVQECMQMEEWSRPACIFPPSQDWGSYQHTDWRGSLQSVSQGRPSLRSGKCRDAEERDSIRSNNL